MIDFILHLNSFVCVDFTFEESFIMKFRLFSTRCRLDTEQNANVVTCCQDLFFLCLVTFSDHVFGPKTNNYEVFNTVARHIIDSSVSGFNGTIFAYGQTSSGNVMF